MSGWLSQLGAFGSGHDLIVGEFKPRIGLCVDSAEPALDPLTSSFSAPPQFSLSLSLKKKHLIFFSKFSYFEKKHEQGKSREREG